MTDTQPNRPWPNTYWVTPGRFLAGEYPGSKDADEAAAKVDQLIEAGIDYYIDLTEDRELDPYENLLAAAAEKRGKSIHYRRMSIRDLSVPETRDHMSAILDAIDDALEAGRNVYVHCWGGIGRTGTVIGCHLARHGTRGDPALQRLRELFAAMEKAATKTSPETPAQQRWVREWDEQREPR